MPRTADAFTIEAVKRLAGLGFTRVVTHLVTPPEELIRTGAGARVRATLADEQITVAQATGYNPNLVLADKVQRAQEIERLRFALLVARDLGSDMVLTGCGSLHPTFFYGPSPANHDQETINRLVDSLARVAEYAEGDEMTVALECHVMTSLATPEVIRGVIDRVGSARVRVNFDPVNLLGDLEAVYRSGDRIRAMWDTLGPVYVPTAHIKDIRPEPELVVRIAEVPPGQGVLDFEAVFDVVRKLGPSPTVIIEHLAADQIEAAVRFTREAARRVGLAVSPG